MIAESGRGATRLQTRFSSSESKRGAGAATRSRYPASSGPIQCTLSLRYRLLTGLICATVAVMVAQLALRFWG
jgi:hypothetical protein